MNLDAVLVYKGVDARNESRYFETLDEAFEWTMGTGEVYLMRVIFPQNKKQLLRILNKYNFVVDERPIDLSLRRHERRN